MVDIPRIGMTSYFADVAWGGVWRQKAAFLPRQYLDLFARGGGAPVILPPVEGTAEAVVRGVDGLVLSGGPDVSPEQYGADREALCETSDPERDSWELAVLGAALDRGLPVLAVCRGLQLLNVAYGGTLHQHLPLVTGNDHHRVSVGTFRRNQIKPEPGTLLEDVLRGGIEAPCHHHQAVAVPGDGLSVSARADDGVIEGLVDPSRPFVLGVQWHPEEDTDISLARALVDAARRKGSESPDGNA